MKRRKASRRVFATRWMSVREDVVVMGDGSESTFAVVSRSDSVLAVCQRSTGHLVMTWQYRYATDSWSLEFPQGGREPGESVTDAALRELREETGWIGAEPEVLAQRLYEAGDWATQSFAVVRVRPETRGTPDPGPDEIGLGTRLVHPSELHGYLVSGQLSDAATLAALAVMGMGSA